MEHEVKIPDVGEEVTEVEIAKWHVEVGANVTKGDPLAELLADKAEIDLESDFEGTVTKVLQPEGAVVEVGGTVATIESK